MVKATQEVVNGVALLRLDNPPVNALGQEACRQLVFALRKLKGDHHVKAIVLASSSDRVPFSAGADIREFDNVDRSAASDNSAISSLDRVIEEVEEANVPVVAAIAGVALGGGLELALGCHYRVALSTARLGLPEVTLGIIPGSGGTQRLPRLVGIRKAYEMIVTGKPVSAKEAKERGLVDVLVPHSDKPGAADSVVQGALAFVESGLRDGSLRVRRTREREVPAGEGGEGPTETIRQAAKTLRIPPAERGGEAQAACAEVVGAAGLVDINEGLAMERAAFTRLLRSAQSGALRYAFKGERGAARAFPKDGRPMPVKSAGVIGGGTTGSGIVVSFLETGAEVTLVERNEDALETAVEVVRFIFASKVRRGQLTYDAAMEIESRFKGSTRLEDLSNVDLVVEAVFEDMQLKKDVFGRLDRICPPHAILATNTSSLDIDQIAAATRRPAQVLGMHFFSPTFIMRLVECVRGSATSPHAIATLAAVSKAMRKVCALVGNCDGFVGNRMLFMFRAEMEKLVEEGASPYAVDRVLYDYGFPMGPFAVSDLAGLDVGVKIKKARVKLTGIPMEESLSDRLSGMGRDGQKTGKGWYLYDLSKGRAGIPDPEVLAFVERFRREKGMRPRTDITDQEILERCMYPLVNEGFKILGEGIAASAADVDVIWREGYSFPRWRGGPMYWAAEEVGLGALLSTIRRYHEKEPGAAHWQPAPLLEKLVQDAGPGRARL